MNKPGKRFANARIILAFFSPVLVLADPSEFRDGFERDKIGDAWTSHANSFSIRDGILVASQLPDAAHGAVMRAQLDFRDAVIDFSFKYDGGSVSILLLMTRIARKFTPGIFVVYLFARAISAFRMTEWVL